MYGSNVTIFTVILSDKFNKFQIRIFPLNLDMYTLVDLCIPLNKVNVRLYGIGEIKNISLNGELLVSNATTSIIV